MNVLAVNDAVFFKFVHEQVGVGVQVSHLHQEDRGGGAGGEDEAAETSEGIEEVLPRPGTYIQQTFCYLFYLTAIC